jgi:transposase-like protein
MSSKKLKSKAERRQFWEMAIETWKNSGLSISKFCEAEGLSEGTFYGWRRRLSNDQSQESKQSKLKPAPFIEVSMPKNDHAAIELLLSSGHTLRIRSSADSKTLSNVISALRQAGLC